MTINKAMEIPVGYQTQMMTLDNAIDKYGDKMHPEYRTRLFNWLASKGGSIGIGSAWRPTPHGVSKASQNGWSFHQYQDFGGFNHCTAVDLVAVSGPNKNHRAPRWDEVMVQGGALSRDWGLHCNVPNETWHMQPIELDGYWSWRNAGRPDLFFGYPQPGNMNPTPPPSGMPPFRPEAGEFSLWPINQHKPRLAQEAFVLERLSRGYDNWTSRGDAVRYMQGVILHKAGGGITVDGDYGPVTAGRMEDMQKWFNLEVDGLVGPQTWGLIDALSVT